MQKSVFDAAIGDKIRMARVEKRISQQTLADHIGLTQHAISQYEQGTRSISLRLMTRLAREFEKPLTYFLECGGDVVLVRDTRLYDMVVDVQSSNEATNLLYDIWQFLLFRKARRTNRLDWKSVIGISNDSAQPDR